MPGELAVLYFLRAGDAFQLDAAAHARAHFPSLEVGLRNPAFYHLDPTNFERMARAVYVQTRFPQVIDEYRAAGVPVFTEVDLAPPPVPARDPSPQETTHEVDQVEAAPAQIQQQAEAVKEELVATPAPTEGTTDGGNARSGGRNRARRRE